MVSTEQVAEFERQRQGQAMMTTYISSAIREKKQVCCHVPFLMALSIFFPVPRLFHTISFIPTAIVLYFLLWSFFSMPFVIINLVERVRHLALNLNPLLEADNGQ